MDSVSSTRWQVDRYLDAKDRAQRIKNEIASHSAEIGWHEHEIRRLLLKLREVEGSLPPGQRTL